MKDIKVKATWHIIIDKDFTKERNINGYISFDAIIKVLIHIPYFRYVIYGGEGLNRTEKIGSVEGKSYGFYITNLNKLEEILSTGLDMLIKDFHLNIDKSLNYTRIKNLYIDTYLRGYNVDTKIIEEITISEGYIKKHGGKNANKNS